MPASIGAPPTRERAPAPAPPARPRRPRARAPFGPLHSRPRPRASPRPRQPSLCARVLNPKPEKLGASPAGEDSRGAGRGAIPSH